jgi:hypothetical protein
MVLYFSVGIIFMVCFVIFQIFAFVLEIGFDEDDYKFKINSFPPLVFEDESFMGNFAISFLVGIIFCMVYPITLIAVFFYFLALKLKKYLKNKDKKEDM